MKIIHESPSFRTGQRVSLVLAAVCAAAAVLLAMWPRDWIEEVFGVQLDGGSGLLELVPIIVLALAAAALTARVARARRRPSASIPEAG
jgi:hypothetical protein